MIGDDEFKAAVDRGRAAIEHLDRVLPLVEKPTRATALRPTIVDRATVEAAIGVKLGSPEAQELVARVDKQAATYSTHVLRRHPRLVVVLEFKQAQRFPRFSMAAGERWLMDPERSRHAPEPPGQAYCDREHSFAFAGGQCLRSWVDEIYRGSDGQIASDIVEGIYRRDRVYADLPLRVAARLLGYQVGDRTGQLGRKQITCPDGQEKAMSSAELWQHMHDRYPSEVIDRSEQSDLFLDSVGMQRSSDASDAELACSPPLSAHAQIILKHAFVMKWPVFEAEAMRSVPIMELPWKCDNPDFTASVFEELATAGLIVEWAPSTDSDQQKPHPQLPLKQYWPSGRIWILRSDDMPRWHSQSDPLADELRKRDYTSAPIFSDPPTIPEEPMIAVNPQRIAFARTSSSLSAKQVDAAIIAAMKHLPPGQAPPGIKLPPRRRLTAGQLESGSSEVLAPVWQVEVLRDLFKVRDGWLTDPSPMSERMAARIKDMLGQ